MQSDSGAAQRLLRSGVVFSAISLVTGLGNLAFQGVMGRHLVGHGEYGDANTAITGFMPLLGMLPQIAIFAVTHYIAHFAALGDRARLHGLLLGCRRLIFWVTIAGSLLAIIVIKPLSAFFHYRQSLMLVTLGCALLGLWGSFATMLCQGFGWYKRLALIGFLGMLLRVGFGWFITFQWPSAETAVLASGFALLANLILLYWRKDLALPGAPVAPWNREFGFYCLLSAALVVGNFCFFLGDLLVAQKFFVKTALDDYTAAGALARALPQTVAPMLAVLFTSRSSHRRGAIVGEQIKLIVLSGAGLAFGAVCLIAAPPLFLKLLGRDNPAAAAMLAPYAVTMIFVGLLQGLASWALASRWSKVVLLHGTLGLIFWLTLLAVGRSPDALLRAMPLTGGAAFAVLLVFWLIAMRRHRPAPSAPA